MSNFNKTFVIKETGAKKVSTNVDGISSSAKGADKSFANMVKSGLAIGTVTVVTKQLADALIKSTKASIEQEQIFKKLETSVNLAGASYKDNKKELDELFASQQAFTQYGDTESAEMLTKLINFSGDYEASVKNLALAQDIASTGLFDMSSSARYVGLALAGNTEMLGRYIPELKAGSEEMQGITNKADKVAKAMEILNDRFGGTARKNIQTTAGALEQAKNITGDLQEAIGDRLNPVVGDLARGWTDWVRSILETPFDRTIRQMKEVGIEADTINKAIAKRDQQEAVKDLKDNYNDLRKSISIIPTDLKLSNDELRSFAKTVFGLQDETDEFGELVPIKDSLQFAENLQVAINDISKRYDEQSVMLNDIENVNSRRFKKQENHLNDIFQEYQYLLEIQQEYNQYMDGVKTLEEVQERINKLKNGDNEKTKETTEAVEEQTEAVKNQKDEYIEIAGIVDNFYDEAIEAQRNYMKEFQEQTEILSSYASYLYDIIDIAQNYNDKILDIRENELETELDMIRQSETYANASIERRAKLEKETLNELEQIRKEQFLEEQERYQTQLAQAQTLAVLQQIGRGEYLQAIATFGVSWLNQIVSGFQFDKEARSLYPEAYADGGYIDRPQFALIGEAGDEGILNAQATRNIGGRAGVDALNSGQSVGTTVNFIVQGDLIVDNDERVIEIGNRINELTDQGFING